jgi:hypothetical protein
MADDVHALKAERIEQWQEIVDQLVGAVPIAGRFGPAEAAQVRAGAVVVGCKYRDDVAPGVPVLRSAVDEGDRLAFASLRSVHAQPRRLDEAVPDAVNLRSGRANRGVTAGASGLRTVFMLPPVFDAISRAATRAV